jgi:uncharacterized iron-regulated protein
MTNGRSMALVVVMSVGAVGAQGDELDLLPLGDPDRAYLEASASVGSLVDCRTGQEISLDEMVRAADESRVVVLGEQHTAWEQKVFQARFLDALARQGGKVVLGLEFFHREHTDSLERWRRGQIDTSELLGATEWYDRGSIRFAYYAEVLEVARRHGIPLVGLNVPRAIPRAVNMGGLDALDADQRALVGAVDVAGSAQHRYLFARYMGDTVAQLPPAWLTNMYAAQCLWDVVMARSILDRLPSDGTFVAIVGSAHAAYGLGVSRRIDEERHARGEPRLPVLTFCPVSAPPPPADDERRGHPMSPHHGAVASTQTGRFTRSLADVVGVFADTGGLERWPVFGLQVEDSAPDAVTLTRVWPGTFADDMGLEKGDRLLSYNGAAVGTAAELRLALAGLEWGQRASFELERAGEPQMAAVLVYPELATSESTTVPGWSVEPALPLDPDSTDVARVAVAAEPPGESWTLVEQDGAGVRLEVRRGGALAVVHELDTAGRVVRSLYREAQTDGAVEVRTRRDEEGRVVDRVRLDQRGDEIESTH